MSKGNWYVATLLIQSYVGESTADLWLCDEQIRLIRAVNAEQAYEKAILLGKEEETSYHNEFKETVTWKFMGLIELQELDVASIRDGVEIRSKLFHHSEPNTLILEKEALNVFL